jgi:hypothetical protein
MKSRDIVSTRDSIFTVLVLRATVLLDARPDSCQDSKHKIAKFAMLANLSCQIVNFPYYLNDNNEVHFKYKLYG